MVCLIDEVIYGMLQFIYKKIFFVGIRIAQIEIKRNAKIRNLLIIIGKEGIQRIKYKLFFCLLMTE